jgi:hypothetical protein
MELPRRRSSACPLSGEPIQRGIRVNVVCDIHAALGLSEAVLKTVSASIESQVPAGRFGNPGEVSQAVVFSPLTNARSQSVANSWGVASLTVQHQWAGQDQFPPAAITHRAVFSRAWLTVS